MAEAPTKRQKTNSGAIDFSVDLKNCVGQCLQLANAKHGTNKVDELACQFGVFSLALSHLNEGSLDMYFGPEEWSEEVKKCMQKHDLHVQDKQGFYRDLLEAVTNVCHELEKLAEGASEMQVQSEGDETAYRVSWLLVEVTALAAHIRQLCGRKCCFDEQCIQLYDLHHGEGSKSRIHPLVTEFAREKLPAKSIERLGEKLTLLEERLGIIISDSTLSARFDAVRKHFLVPKIYYENLFMVALRHCKKKCEENGLSALKLPEMKWLDDSSISWEAFEQFKRDGRSEMQVNLARLLTIDKFLQLPAHEAYPGHHYMFTKVEQELVKKKRFLEFSVVNTFSPYGFIAEGGAEWGAQGLLWGNFDERIAFVKELAKQLQKMQMEEKSDKDVFFPQEEAVLEAWCEVAAITDPLDFENIGPIHVHIAKKLVDGAEENFALDDARQAMLEKGFRENDSWPNAPFLEEMGAYILNYSFGKKVVNAWVKNAVRVKKEFDNEYQAFEAFAARPVPPSTMLGVAAEYYYSSSSVEA